MIFKQLPLVDEDLSDDDDSLDLQKAFDQIRSSSDESLSESEYLAVIVASKLASSHSNHLITSLLFHTALLSELRLSDRMLENGTYRSFFRRLMSIMILNDLMNN